MYFSKITLRPDTKASEILKKLGPNAHQAHKLIWDLFSDSADRKRDFIYRFDMDGASACFFAVSERPPMDPDGMWVVETKPYEPRLMVGDRLNFMLRANPVVTRRDEEKKHKRHDLVMDIKHQARESGQVVSGDVSIIAVCRWLIERSDRHGFRIDEDSIRVGAIRQMSFFKGRGRNPVSITTMDITGALEVFDSLKLEHTLFHGLGPAKGYGCGLMLIRRT